MVASHHPRVIAVGEGRGDLLRVAVLLSEECRGSTTTRRGGSGTGSSKGGGKGGLGGPLAAASAHVDVDFSASEVPQRPDFVQNDGGGSVGSGHNGRDRKNGRDMSDLHDILKGTEIVIVLLHCLPVQKCFVIALNILDKMHYSLLVYFAPRLPGRFYFV